MADKVMTIFDNSTRSDIAIPLFDYGDGTFGLFPLVRPSDTARTVEFEFTGPTEDGDTFTVEGKVWTFKDDPVAPYDVQIGPDGSTTINNFRTDHLGLEPLLLWDATDASPILRFTAKATGTGANDLDTPIADSADIAAPADTPGVTARINWALKTVVIE